MNRPNRRDRAVLVLSASGLVATVFALVGCSSEVPGTGSAAGDQVTAYQSAMSVVRASESAAAQKAATVALCTEVAGSARAIIGSYNAFIVKLNQTQQYPLLAGTDLAAIKAFDIGAVAIKAKIVPAALPSVVTSANAMVDASVGVSNAIKTKQTVGLNAPMDNWIATRNRTLDSCRPMVPAASVQVPAPAPIIPPPPSR